ncbi:hypothetical protein IEQ34_013729 [Dendrobium chrysotoxum]|uniref:Uncharacterized protein n=1 Tax=Dendrobium chrysotoxum TaxID=161865 RepID=A0AAV7G9E1_DENCH|nr:hypothetical protein IEQ34_013729 [Dendrobium chrysotoxum]
MSNISQSTSHPLLLSDAIKVLDQITEVFEDITIYLYSIKLLEDPIKREMFMSMLNERRIHIFVNSSVIFEEDLFGIYEF